MFRCKHCGARSIPFRRNCDLCGTSAAQCFENTASVEKGPGLPGSATDFERLMVHPDFERLVQAVPQIEPSRKREKGARSLFILLVLSAHLFVMSKGPSKLMRGDVEWPFVYVLILGLAALRRRSRRKAFAATHVESLAVRIDQVQTDERWPGAGWVKVIVEMRSGQRRRLRYRATGSEQWADRDMGVAHIKANVLVEFHRLTL